MSEQSVAMMNLLKELALLKELDGKSKTEPTAESDVLELKARESRRRQITNEIKILGEEAAG